MDGTRGLVWRSGSVPWALAAACLGLAACHGSKAGAPPAPGPVTRTLTEAGGTVEVAGLALEFPPGAVRGSLTVTVTPLPPASGAFASFRLAPAGVVLRAPLTLRFHPPELPAGAAAFWDVAGEPSLFLTSRAGGSLTASIRSLGYGPAGEAVPGARASGRSTGAAAAPPGGGLDFGVLDCDAHLALLRARFQRTDWEHDLDRAVELHDQYVALVQACAALEREALQARACAAYEGAAAVAAVVAADGYEAFDELVRPLVTAAALARLTGAACDTSSLEAHLAAKFGQFLDFWDTARPGVGDALRRRQLTSLIRYDAQCRLLELGTVCDRFAGELYPQTLSFAREDAYDTCLEEDSSLQLAQLFELGRDQGPAGPFLGFADYDYAGLEADLHHCTASTLELRVFEDAATVPVELPSGRREIRGGGAPGSHTTSAEVQVPPGGSLLVAGQVNEPACPDATAAADALVARIAGVEIARRPAAGTRYGIAVNPIDVLLDRDLPLAGLDPASPFTLELSREGAGCGLYSTSHRLYTVDVEVTCPPPSPLTATARARAAPGQCPTVDLSGTWSGPFSIGFGEGQTLSATLVAVLVQSGDTVTGTYQIPDDPLPDHPHFGSVLATVGGDTLTFSLSQQAGCPGDFTGAGAVSGDGNVLTLTGIEGFDCHNVHGGGSATLTRQ